ncbi:MAG: metal-dependent hydrolase [Verrucomicrobia bacterium]|nr:metal-dependent hydrolase [Verrucomicrobiota bacterium]
MPSPVGHGLMGVAIYSATVPRRRLFWSWGFLALCVGASLVQDLDFIIPAMFGRIDVTLWAHRSLTHTVFFAFGMALLWFGVARVIRPRSKAASLAVATVVLLCLLAHIGLDILNEDTRPPYGVEVFWPVWNRAFYLNIGLLPSVHKYTYADLVSWHNVTVALTELLVFGALVAVVLALRLGIGQLKERRSVKSSTREAA